MNPMNAVVKALQFDARKTDYLNIGLIIISLLLAFYIPFELFLFAYAVLGPLHYLTEISWLRSKGYFVSKKNLILGIGIFCASFALPAFIFFQSFPDIITSAGGKSVILFFAEWTNGMIFTALIFAFGLVFIKQTKYLIAFLAIGLIVGYSLNYVPFYQVLIGALLPTVIHVYLFTLLFMLYGALKAKSRPAMVGIVLALLCPLIIILMPIDPNSYYLTEDIKQTFLESKFHFLVATIAGILGVSSGNEFYFYEQPFIKIQIFIAFAYCYHYLNWFSKTSVIGWHKNLNLKKVAIITAIWGASIFLYWYDYKVGFASLVFLSMLHLFLEFPLNWISMKGIWGELRNRAYTK